MKTFNKQAESLKRNLKQKNLIPLFVVFSVIVMLSLMYKSTSNVDGVGNIMFKEGNKNRGRRVRQGFREGSNRGRRVRQGFREGSNRGRRVRQGFGEEIEGLDENIEGIEDEIEGPDEDGIEEFRNKKRRARQGFREGSEEEEERFKTQTLPPAAAAAAAAPAAEGFLSDSGIGRKAGSFVGRQRVKKTRN